MSEHVKPSRRYRSAVRAEQAQRTQSRILGAARALFLERGFAATTLAAIAEQAGVAPETIYAIYRTKAGLLGNVVRAAVLRDGGPEDVLEHRWVKELLRLPDPPAQLAALARHTARTVELTSPMHTVIAAAGSGNGELDDLRRELREMRFDGQARVIAAIADERTLRPGLTPEAAADTFSALASPELHHVLTADRGWSQERYARWLQETARAALLRES
jgi:AcrR family transcriptional regulator